MVRKALVLALALCLVMGWSFAQQNLVIPYVYKTTKPVVIDTDLKEWNFCFPIDFSRESISDSSRPWIDGWIPATDTVCSGRLYMMYDDTYLYFAADVRDESPGHFSDAGWAATAIEYYISNRDLGPNALAGDHLSLLDSTYAYDFQLNISFSARLDSMIINFYNNGATGNKIIPWNRDDVKYRIWDGGDGYVIEGRLSWATLQSVNGFSGKFVPGTRVACTWSLYHMSVNELSGDFKGYAYSKTGMPAWAGPANWEVVDVLGAPTAEWFDNSHFDFVQPYVKKVLTGREPVIDTDLKEWNFCFPVDFSRESIPDSSRPWIDGWVPATDTVCSGRLYMMYDDNYLYVAANVRDESPGHFSDAGWAATAVEFYMSNRDLGPGAMAGDHLSMLDSTFAYDFQLNISFSARLDSMIVNFYNNGATGNKILPWDRSTMKYRVWDGGDGYVIEGKIPWSDLQSVNGFSGKYVAGTHIAYTWSLYHMSVNELSGDFKGYAYSKTGFPAWAGPANWNVVTVKDVAYPEVAHMVATDVRMINHALPSSFSLSAAYPNPFNPSTNVQYTLDKAGVTSLKVYNILGQLVSIPVNNSYQVAGTYKVGIDMSRAASGVYIYVLEQGRNRLAQKMVLMK